MSRSAKRKDFDYYVTNLDWGDGGDIDRTIKQFTRNDVFEHTYEKPGFYSIKGLVFKYNELGIEALGEPKNDMSEAGWTTEYYDYFTGHPQEGQQGSKVKTQRTITQLSSSMSQIKIRPFTGDEGDETSVFNYRDMRYEITEMFKSNTPIYLSTNSDVSEHLKPNSIIAEFEKRPNTNGNQANDRLPGISINIPIQLDVSKIDSINYSFEVNLPNYNLSSEAMYSLFPLFPIAYITFLRNLVDPDLFTAVPLKNFLNSVSEKFIALSRVRSENLSL